MAKRAFLTHLAVYVIINMMLIIINPKYFLKVKWFIYSIIGWRIGVLMHYLFGVHWIRRSRQNLRV